MQRENAPNGRRGFTLVELLIVMMIIALLAAMALSALGNAAETARVQRTRAIVNKLDQLVGERWESYRTRAVPYTRGADPRTSAMNRLNALREIQRMELPERVEDVVDTSTNSIKPTATGLPQSSLQRAYFRKAVAATGNVANWTTTHQGAECLYLIVSTIKDGDKNALEYFTPSEIGDVDGDGMKEILDGWGNPIEFLRWAPGFVDHKGSDGEWGVAGVDDDSNGVVDDVSEVRASGSDDLAISNRQTPNYITSPDPFDPIKVDKATNYALYPLIFSAGPNGEYEVNTEGGFDYLNPPSGNVNKNDPFSTTDSGVLIGSPGDTDSDGYQEWTDNITNHFGGEQ
jgi:prepilin-type N-terminal cleavage/methylation domain-containing protein